MTTNPFHFKQFTVRQDKCAMKVGTDGMLLGGWSMPKGANKILDIGTGSGLLSLMMAQKSDGAIIYGIDIDEIAVNQARENIYSSPWPDRINITFTSLQNFHKSHPSLFDLIICNPPYFSNSKKAPDKRRTLARHNDTLSFNDLGLAVKTLLAKEGRFHLILPYDHAEKFVATAQSKELFLTNQTLVKPTPLKAPKRVLMELQRKPQPLKEDELIIETGARHQYTPEFKMLVKDFYLYL